MIPKRCLTGVNTPKSRNEKLVALMKQFDVCEERESGIDKVVSETEIYQLPAPLFKAHNGFTRATLLSLQSFDDMTTSDRVRACYLHACLQYVESKKLTNKSLIERFGLGSDKTSVISRVISMALKKQLICHASQSESRRDTSYVPYWAV